MTNVIGLKTVFLTSPCLLQLVNFIRPETCLTNTRLAAELPVSIFSYEESPFNCQVHGWKSMEQMLWETLQFYPTARDSCVARAIQSGVTGRQKLEKCGQEIERRINSYHHLHISVATNMVSFVSCSINSHDVCLLYNNAFSPRNFNVFHYTDTGTWTIDCDMTTLFLNYSFSCLLQQSFLLLLT